jgi:protoporphyrinogen oxidase
MTNPRGMTSDEREEALTLLKDEELLARVQKDLTTIGVINEEKNKTLLYLIATSRKMPVFHWSKLGIHF